MKGIIAILFLGSLSWFHRLNAGEIRFEVAPNPSHGEVKLELSERPGNNVQIEIYSILGNKISSFHIRAGEQHILLNLSSLTNGIYLIRLTDGQNSSVKRVKIQH